MNREPLHPDEAPGLSIVVGGPLYQAYLRARLAKPQIELPGRRIAAAVLIAWAPLVVLTAAEGRALGGVDVPFFSHLTAQVRFLVALPLLIVAEVVVHGRIVAAVGQFTERGLVAPADRGRFDEIIGAARRLRDSRWIEAILVVLAYTLGYWVWKRYIAMHTGTWYAAEGYDTPLTVAGYWHVLVSMPLFRFLLIRWYFRLLVWYVFLWRVSRLQLRLNALHPDRAGGLGFLNGAAFAFAPLLLAHTALVAGKIGDRIWHENATLPQFKLEILAVILLLMALVYLPMLFFTLHVSHARRAGHREFGAFAARYVDSFRAKWIEREAGVPPIPPENPLGTGDIQSLADLANSFDVIREMGATPIAGRAAARLATLTILPLAPLVLTMIPLEQLIDRLIRLLI